VPVHVSHICLLTLYGTKTHVVLATYEALQGNGAVFRRVPRWDCLVVDEGQRLKGGKASLRSRKLLLRGVPMKYKQCVNTERVGVAEMGKRTGENDSALQGNGAVFRRVPRWDCLVVDEGQRLKGGKASQL
jgi:hypothetical protein